MKKNIFVIGDLVVDHNVFVQEPTGPHQQIEGEPIYEVVRRVDTAGGAANCARILAVLSEGITLLWGVTGRSNWGSFRSILENGHAIDGARSNVKFRGVEDETGARMNTITRLILIGEQPWNVEKRTHKARFDDYGHVHVPEEKRDTVVYYLKRTHEKHTLDAVIINDLDMNCLTKEVIKRIASFANQPNPEEPPIPLFVDPKRDRDKYADIEGTAILPNLSEWCHLVEQANSVEKWRKIIEREEERGLAEMAQLSFRFLGNFRFHVIKCDRLGSIVIAPHPDKSDRYAVYIVKPHPPRRPDLSPQIGCGDVMTAVFAMEFSKSDQSTSAALDALQKANAVVACYRETSWHQMPSRGAVDEALQTLIKPQLVAEPSKGMLFLPKVKSISMADFETLVPGLFSDDATFKERLENLINDMQAGWKGRLKSIILGAPSGSGKTTLMSELQGSWGTRLGISALDSKEIGEIDWSNLGEFFETLTQKTATDTGKLLIVVDEALKGRMGEDLRTHGVVMLNLAHEHSVRFLFIDALFRQGGMLDVSSEFTTRCNPVYLSGLVDRPKDIPYIIAGIVLKQPERIDSVRIEPKFLLAVTNAILSDPNPRVLCQWVEAAYEAARKDWDGRGSFNLRFSHLPKDGTTWQTYSAGIEPEDYIFYR